jgi:hypothetical protein
VKIPAMVVDDLKQIATQMAPGGILDAAFNWSAGRP